MMQVVYIIFSIQTQQYIVYATKIWIFFSNKIKMNKGISVCFKNLKTKGGIAANREKTFRYVSLSQNNWKQSTILVSYSLKCKCQAYPIYFCNCSVATMLWCTLNNKFTLVCVKKMFRYCLHWIFITVELVRKIRK